VAAARDDDGFCVNCHRSLASRVKGTEVGERIGLRRRPSAFRLSMRKATRCARYARIERAFRNSNLDFPHDKHLDPAGVKSPTRGAWCSTAAPATRQTRPPPISSRSRWSATAASATAWSSSRRDQREVPHGRPAEAVNVVNDFYAT